MHEGCYTQLMLHTDNHIYKQISSILVTLLKFKNVKSDDDKNSGHVVKLSEMSSS